MKTILLGQLFLVLTVFGLAWLYFSKFSPLFKEKRRLRKLRRDWKGRAL